MLFLYFTAYDSAHLCYNNTGLGNVLFQISCQYSICKKYNIKPNFLFFKNFIEKLKTFNLNDYQNTIFRNFKLDEDDNATTYMNIQEHKCHLYDDTLINKIIENSDRNIIITNSYLQSLKYFQEYSTEICELFSPDKTSISKITLKYPQLFDKDITSISLHIRLNWGQNIKCVSNYFIDAINYIKTSNQITNNIIIFIFSDNINQSKTVLSNITQDVIYCEDNLDYIDLWTMSMCNHNITCHSTLGWWGAYLNPCPNKMVIYPRDMLEFYSNLTDTDIVLLEENYIPNEWICLNSTSACY
jgi:hypothetical protein